MNKNTHRLLSIVMAISLLLSCFTSIQKGFTMTAHAQSTASLNTNLIQNPGAEMGGAATNPFMVTSYNWPPLTGNDMYAYVDIGRTNPLSPHSGNNYIAVVSGNTVPTSRDCYQDIDVSSLSTSIDNNAITFQFSGFIQRTGANAGSVAKIQIKELDASGNPVSSGYEVTSSSFNSWEEASINETLHSGTRKIRIVLIGNNIVGGYNPSSGLLFNFAAFDDLSLVLANTAPTMTSVAGQTMKAGDTIGPLSFTVTDPDTPLGSINVTAASSDQEIIKDADIQVNYSSGNGSITLKALPNTEGSSNITITVSDGTGNIPTTFTVDVNLPNLSTSSVNVPSAKTYQTGETLDFIVNYPETVVVDTSAGTPYIPIELESGNVNAAYTSGSGTTALTFSYTTTANDWDTDGISMGDEIQLSNAMITDALGNDAYLNLNNIGTTSGILLEYTPVVIAQGECGASGNNLTWELWNNYSLVIEGTGAMANYEINQMPWESYQNQISKLELKDGITSIGNYAFYECNNIDGELSIPASVMSIGEHAFEYCNKFTSTLISRNVTSIGNRAFSSWKSGSSIYNLSNVDMQEDVHYSIATLGTVYIVSTKIDGLTDSITKVLADNLSVVNIPDPVRPGYIFKGWYTDSDYLNTWTGNGNAVTSNLELFAKFQKVLELSNIVSIENKAVFTYDGSTKEIPVTITLTGYNPSGGTPVAETVSATVVLASENVGTYTSYQLKDIILPANSNYLLGGATSFTITGYDEDDYGVTINKMQAVIQIAAGSEIVNKTYGDANFFLTGITNNMSGAMTYQSSNPSVATVDSTGKVNIHVVGTTTITVSLAAGDNYLAATDKMVTLTVNKKPISSISQEYLVVKQYEKEYSFDLSNLLPALSEGERYKNLEFTIASVTNAQGVLKTNPQTADILDGKLNLQVKNVLQKDKTAEITISFTSENYDIGNAIITVKTTDKTPLTISNVQIPDREYNAESYAYTTTPILTNNTTNQIVAGVDYMVEYEGTNTTDYTKSVIAPKKAGTYKLIVRVKDNSIYEGSIEIPFQITKKEIVLQALNKTIAMGEEIPAIGIPVKDVDYTINGLIGEDTLSKKVTLQYRDVPDNTKAGTVEIVASDATAGDNYKMTFVNGLLTIKQTYGILVNNGTANRAKALPGTIITITANEALQEKVFDYWSISDDITLFNAKASTTTFIMPEKDVTISANYKDSSTTDGNGKKDDSGTPDSASSGESSTTSEDNTNTTLQEQLNLNLEIKKNNENNNNNTNENEAGMQGADGKIVTGWESILQETEREIREAFKDSNSQEALTIIIEFNTNTTLPKSMLETIKGKNVDLVLQLPNGMTWTINGLGITGKELADIDLDVSQGTDSIPEDSITELVGDRNAIQLELAHSGAFGFEATLSIELKKENSGQYANLFYYNEETKAFELLDSNLIDDGGMVNLTFVHASSYVVVVDEKQMEEITKTDTKEVKDDSNLTKGEAKDSINLFHFVLGMIVVIGLSGIATYFRYRKNEIEED